MARVRAALRRHEAPEPFLIDALAIDFDHHPPAVGGEVIVLTAAAYELFRLLALDAGWVLTYDTLLTQSAVMASTPQISASIDADSLRAKH